MAQKIIILIIIKDLLNFNNTNKTHNNLLNTIIIKSNSNNSHKLQNLMQKLQEKIILRE